MELRLATVPLTDPTWIEYARTFFTALVQQRVLASQTDDRDLLRMIESASVRELALLLGNTPAAPPPVQQRENALRRTNDQCVRLTATEVHVAAEGARLLHQTLGERGTLPTRGRPGRRFVHTLHGR